MQTEDEQQSKKKILFYQEKLSENKTQKRNISSTA